MAIIATGQKTIIDLSDGKSLSAYLGSNQPRTQIFDVNNNSYSPDWTTTTGKLVITPVIYANQTPIALSDSKLAITWKRKEGSGSEASLTTGETISGNVLTVNVNKMGSITSGLLTYIAYVTYTDPDTNLPINATADISFAMIKTGENAKSVWISGEQVFKYSSAGGSATPSQITLTANVQNVVVQQWQYKASNGSWAAYPTTADNASISGTSLVVKPTHNIWVGDVASIRVTTSDGSIADTTSVYKIVDGSAGVEASVVFLTNENITFAGNVSGQVAATTKTCNVVAYKGTTKVTPTVGTISGAPSGMTVTAGSASNNEIPITITVSANATLGGSGQVQGDISIPITSPVSTTLKIYWSKVNTGATGQTGANAVVFSLYTPNGSKTINGAGTLLVQTSAYDGATTISSGATYKWYKYSGGTWTAISGATSASYSVSGSSINGLASFKCEMTYKSKTYTDTITLEDKTDNYQAVIESSGGDIFKNTQGTSTLVCRLFQNGEEVDASGDGYTYTWYRLDKDGNALDGGQPFATGKSVSVDGSHVDVKTTFTCEVT